MKIDDLLPDMYCIPRGLHFIDMNADGLDDIACIDPDGNLYVSINQGDGGGNKPPSFKMANNGAAIKTSEAKQEHVKLADIDGDGRGDYVVVDYNGKARVWRNGGQGDVPEYWQYLGERFNLEVPGPTAGEKAVRFEDINGDVRADVPWLSTTD